MATHASPHLLSGLGKQWSPPQFSKDEPRRKFKQVLTEPLLSYFPPTTQHPDEEKGRSIRSFARTTSIPSTSFSTGLGPAFDLGNGLNDDKDPLEAAWLEDGVPFDMVRQEEEEYVQLRTDLAEVKVNEEPAIRTRQTEAEKWREALAHAVDHSDGKLSLGHQQLTQIPDNISELSTLRKIAIFQPRHYDRPVQSTPSLFSGSPTTAKSPAPARSRPFRRITSIPASPSTRASIATAVELDIDLAGNELTSSSLSNALFELDNLKCLWLRKNALDRLPPGIGRLTNLVGLSLSTNQLEYLPAEILQLENLATLTLHPNPFLSPTKLPPSTAPSVDSSTTEVSETTSSPRSTTRLLGPLTTHFTVPSLREIALRKLLEFDSSYPSQRLVQRWDPTSVRESLPSHDYAAFSSLFPSSSVRCPSDFTRSRHVSASSTVLESHSALPAQPFDPLSNVCRSACHPDEERIFYRPAVERIEWVEERILKPRAAEQKVPGNVAGPKTIPIKWRGCGPHCLDWLEFDDEDDDEVEEGEEETDQVSSISSA